MKKFSWSVWAGLAALILFVLGALGIIVINLGSSPVPQDNVLGTQTQSNQVLLIKVIDANKYEKNFNYDFNLQQTNSLLTVLNTLSSTSDFKIEYKDFDFGKMITAVNGYSVKPNEFWNIKVNGLDAQVGVSDIKIAPGDKVELILTTF